VDGLAHEAASITCMCALKIKEAIYVTRMLVVEVKLMVVVIVRSSRAEFVVMAVIIAAGWWDRMPRNLLLSIIAYIDKGVKHYEHEGGKCCMSIGGDLGRSVVGASDWSWDLRDGEGLVVVRTSERYRS